MPYFTNTQLHIYNYHETTEYNIYGENKKEYIHDRSIPCDFLPLNPTESLHEYGEILQDTYKCYINENEDIPSTSIFKIDDNPETYTLTGSPVHYNYLPAANHKKLFLKRTRKPYTTID